jgi:hypothetical protein
MIKITKILMNTELHTNKSSVWCKVGENGVLWGT